MDKSQQYINIGLAMVIISILVIALYSIMAAACLLLLVGLILIMGTGEKQ